MQREKPSITSMNVFRPLVTNAASFSVSAISMPRTKVGIGFTAIQRTATLWSRFAIASICGAALDARAAY
ncbi:hypothetical protein BBK_756 [Burkholderia pseudomallei NCTC 13179]|nr:hypothetical protein BBK_756 [Burkholderia pseudomallei NCTC 13179]